jgi:hypothetical protein
LTKDDFARMGWVAGEEGVRALSRGRNLAKDFKNVPTRIPSIIIILRPIQCASLDRVFGQAVGVDW